MGIEADAVAQAIIAARTALNVRRSAIGGSARLNVLSRERPLPETTTLRVHIKGLGIEELRRKRWIGRKDPDI